MKKITTTAIVIFLMTISQITNARILYVDNNHSFASDANAGTENLPWKTIQKAARTVAAGDTVYVKKGTYKGEVRMNRSGVKDNYILLSAFPGDEEKVIINGSQIILVESSYVQVSGFYVQNTNNHGIAVRGLSDGVIISGNHTYDTYGSGISVWGVDWGQDPTEGDYDYVRDIVIENNTIEKACNGGWNECITLSNGVNNFKILNNKIYNGGDPTNGGEGIDIKEGCRDGIISGNVIHDLTRRGIYLDGGGHMDDWDTPPLQNIYVMNNTVYSNPNSQGLAIMTEGSADVHSIYIYNNLLYNNGEDGIMFYDHPNGQGDIYDIVTVNNSCYGNKRFGILLNFPKARNMIVRNNICYRSSNSNIKFQAGEYEASNNLTGNPLFVDPDAGNFRLTADSPAIDAGTENDAPSVDFDGNERPQGEAFDIGAFEYVGTSGIGYIPDDLQKKSFVLLQNYPNPFNPRTTIAYALGAASDVSINIFDVSGRLVEALMQDEKQAGFHTIQFDGTIYPSGVYYYKIQTGQFDAANSMLLLK